MPVTAAQSEEKAAKRGRGWLWVPLGLLVLVIVLPVVLFAQPHVFCFGGQVVVILSGPASTVGPPRGFLYWYRRDVPGPTRPDRAIEGTRGGQLYYVNGASRIRGLCLGGRMYAVGWFK